MAHQGIHMACQPVGAADGQKLRGPHRCDREGLQQRDHDGRRDRDPELKEELAYDALHEDDGHEDGQNCDRGGKRRGGNFPGADQGRLHLRHPLFGISGNIFQHHNGVIDDDSDDQGKPQHGKAVNRKSEEAEGDKRPHDGRGDRQEDV